MTMAAKKRTNKKVTYPEFLAWLEGVESMQEAGWTPSATQWQTIREKLNTVKPEVEIREVEAKQPTMAATPPLAFSGYAPAAPAAPSAFEPAPPQHNPVPLTNRPPAAASAHEGVPAANNGPFLSPDGTLPDNNEFL
jgi:hypothetical protein